MIVLVGKVASNSNAEKGNKPHAFCCAVPLPEEAASDYLFSTVQLLVHKPQKL